MKVSMFMSTKVISAKPSDGIRETFFRMRREKVRHMPVLDAEGTLVGIISDRDLRRPDWVDEAIDISHVYRLDDDMHVEDLMTDHVMTVRARDGLDKATTIFREHRFGALPVLGKDGRLAGMLSPHDLLGALAELLAQDRPASAQ